MLRNILFIFCIPFFVIAQQPEKPNSVEIYHQIKKLSFLGSVLYIAAHPDDENTAVISYLSNEVNARTAYLSLTRGDGGQNLIGPEIREALGVIRTEELLKARSVDGGEQFFSRANDFGYSKHPKETLKIWNEDEVLADVVWAIRKFQPDVIINRFSDDPKTFGSTHGHHSSSAILSSKAFDLASDPSSYSEQLKFVEPWKVKRSFFNTSWWFYGSEEKFNAIDKSNMYALDIGTYYPDYGLSNNEISAKSRSMHKSQGFGTTGTRGASVEYFEFVKGDRISQGQDLFEGINTTWSRVEGGGRIAEVLKEVEDEFNFSNPSLSVPKLLEVYNDISSIKNEHWRCQKQSELKAIIFSCLGIFAESVSENQTASVGDSVNVSTEIINRSNTKVKLLSVEIPFLDIKMNETKDLIGNQKYSSALLGKVKEDISPSTPYWLNSPWTQGMYTVTSQEERGMPNAPSQFMVHYLFSIDGVQLDLSKELIYKYNSPVQGEVYKSFSIVPKVTISHDEKVLVFSENESKEIKITINATNAIPKGILMLDVPVGWKVKPDSVKLDFQTSTSTKSIKFDVLPTEKESQGYIKPVFVKESGELFNQELLRVDYAHIPNKNVLFDAKIKVVKVELEIKAKKIGYIEGAGDEIPNSLEQIGCDVTVINVDDITLQTLQRYEAIVLGVRAYNTNEKLKVKQKLLHEYVNQGGVLIVQYNTSHNLKVQELAPYPLVISRDRVTDENSKVKIIAQKHSLVNYPNAISQNDFKDWVQERGLYFPNSWGDEFTPILMMKDVGEKNTLGSLLVANYGQGHFIYTGLSFFRELPAGVPGAYKLFANMLSIGYEE